jgi:hypothetical protein
MSHKPIAIILTLMMSYPSGADTGAGTEASGTPIFSFSGFGSVGVVHSSEDRADFTSSIFKPDGAGYTHPWSAAVDSLIGGQVIANFTTQLTAMVQVISQQNYDNTYSPHVEWANIKYQLTPEASVRVGRTVLASFLVSDTRNVRIREPLGPATSRGL